MRWVRALPFLFGAGVLAGGAMLVPFFGGPRLPHWFGKDGGSQAVTPSATVAAASTAAAKVATAMATARAASPIMAGDLVLSEFRSTETALVRVSITDPADRRVMVRIPHGPNWAPRVAVGPGGDLIAYTVMPPDARTPDTDGVVWLVTLGSRESRRLAERVDVRIAPLWAPDGDRLVYQRVTPGTASGTAITLEELKIPDGKATEIAKIATPDRLFPVGYGADGLQFYYVHFTRDGAYLHAAEPARRGDRIVARLGDGAVRDLKLSPDRRALVYLGISGSGGFFQAGSVDLVTGVTQRLLSNVTRIEHVGVAWRPGVTPSAAVGLVNPEEGISGRIVMAVDGTPVVVSRTTGFDVPVAWSPDGRTLVVRAFSGGSPDAPGREDLVLIDGEGVRRSLSGNGATEFVGWVAHAP